MAARKKLPPMSPADVATAIVRQQGFGALEDPLHDVWSIDARDTTTRTALADRSSSEARRVDRSGLKIGQIPSFEPRNQWKR